MIVEVVAVGTELLLGQIINSNASYIGGRIAEAGFDAHFQVVVGDNLARMEDVLRRAIERSDAVIITGGIGPTPDDVTREAICAATGLSMAYSDEYAQQLRALFETRGRVMPENNLRQAEHPEGAQLLPNPRGSAPGLMLVHEDTMLFAVPGVPAEMRLLVDDEVLPRLREAAGVETALVSRVVRTWGRSESQVAAELEDLFHASTNPSMAYLASSGEIKVRITAKADTEATAEQLIAPVQLEVERRLGEAVFAVDEQTIESVLFALLTDRRWTLGTAESATGGMIAARITSVRGSSAVYRGSIVSYATDLKRSLLTVEDKLLGKGVVSEDVALAMARGAQVRLGVDVAIAVTGSAGPDPQEQPVGTMIVAVATPEDAKARLLHMPGDRERARTYTTTAALHLCRLALTGTWWSR